MPQQLPFDLPAKPALGRSDFFVSPANALAVAMIDRAAGNDGGKLVLSGPAGSGKTHLAHVWAGPAAARIVAARDLAGQDIASLATGATVIEDAPEAAGDRAAEEALFHLHNLLLAGRQWLLVTGRGAPRDWGLVLPDLQSRLEAAPLAALMAPDDALLSAVLAKLFADRQITPRPDLIPYLVTRIDRSFAAAANMVAALDRAALASGRPVGRALAVQLLGARPSGS